MLQQALALQRGSPATGPGYAGAPACTPGYTSPHAPHQEGTSTAATTSSPLCALHHTDFPRRGQRTVLVARQGSSETFTHTLPLGRPLNSLDSLRQQQSSAAAAGPSAGVLPGNSRGTPGAGLEGKPEVGGVGGAPPHSSEDLTAARLRVAPVGAEASFSEPACPWPLRKRQQSFFDGSLPSAKRVRAVASSPCPPLQTLPEEGAGCTSSLPGMPWAHQGSARQPGAHTHGVHTAGAMPSWRGPSGHILLEEEGEGGLSGGELSDANNSSAAQGVGSYLGGDNDAGPGAGTGLGAGIGCAGASAIPCGEDPCQWEARVCGFERRTGVKEEGMELDAVWNDLDLSAIEMPGRKEEGALFGGVTMQGSGAPYNDITHTDTVSASNVLPALTVQDALSPFLGSNSAAAWGSVLGAPGNPPSLEGGNFQGGGRGNHVTPSVDAMPIPAGLNDGSPVLNMEAGGTLEDVVQGASFHFDCLGEWNGTTYS